MSNLLQDLGSYISNKLNKFKQSAIEQAPTMAQNYLNTYKRVSPYIPFAPQVHTPQEIQQNYNNVGNFIKNNSPITPFIQNFNTPQRVVPQVQQLMAKQQTNTGNLLKNTVNQTHQMFTNPNYFSNQGMGANPFYDIYQGTQTPIPYTNFSQNIKNPVLRTIGSVGEGIANMPSALINSGGKLVKGGVNTLGDVNKTLQGKKVPVQSWVRNIANVADLPVNVALMNEGGGDIIKSNSLKNKLISGAQGGWKFGSAIGGLESLQNIKDTDNFGDIAKKVIGEAAQKGVSMGTIGSVLGLGSYGLDRITGKPIIPDFLNGKTVEEANSILKIAKQKIDINTLQEMADFVDYTHGKFKPEDNGWGNKSQFESYIRDMADKYGVGGERTNSNLAKMFTSILDAKKAGSINGPYLRASEARINVPKKIDNNDFIKYLEEHQGDYKKPEIQNPSELRAATNLAKGKSETQPQVFNDLFAKWIGRREAAKTTGVEIGSKVEIPEGIKGTDIIEAIENPNKKVSPEISNVVESVRKQYDELYNYAKESGIDIRYLKDYITHIWKENPEVVNQAYKTAINNFKFSGRRTYRTYEEGIKMGFTPKYTDPRQLISEYSKELEQTKANIDFINSLKDEGLIVAKREPGLQRITGIGFQAPSSRIGDTTIREGVYYAPPEIAKVINRVFNPQESPILLRGASKLSSTVQDIIMSGGVPKTPLNAWTFGQILKEMTAVRIKGPLKALATSLSEGSSNKYFAENSDLIKEQQLNNIPISTTLNTDALANKGWLERVFGTNLSEAWNKTINEPTFKRFMPVLQTEFYKDVKNAALDSGKTSEEAIQIASQATKNWYGFISTDTAAKRNVVVRDLLTTFTFAPKYRESMVNFWLNDLKSIKNPLALENRANVRFMVGATITALAYDFLNRQFTGHSMLQNPPGTEDKLLIPISKLTGNTQDKTVLGIPFLSSIATVPRAILREGKMLAGGDISGAAKDAMQTYTSNLFKPLADIANNQDYFGKQIVDDTMSTQQKLTAEGKYLLNQYVFSHPYLKELTNENNQKDPAYQRLSRATELPFRFYTQSSINSKYFYQAQDTALKSLNTQEMAAFNSLPKLEKDAQGNYIQDNNPNDRILKYQIFLTYPKVFEAKQKTELEMAAKTGQAIDPLYLVNYDTAKKYMRYEALPEGSSDRSAMTKAYPELVALFNVRNKYFQENPTTNVTDTSNKPVASDYVQQQMNNKQWGDSQVQAYLTALNNYNNSQRAILGLPALASSSSSYGETAIKNQLKYSNYKLKTKAIKKANLKVPKAPKFSNKKINFKKLSGLTNSTMPKVKVLKAKKYKPVKLLKVA